MAPHAQHFAMQAQKRMAFQHMVLNARIVHQQKALLVSQMAVLRATMVPHVTRPAMQKSKRVTLCVTRMEILFVWMDIVISILPTVLNVLHTSTVPHAKYFAMQAKKRIAVSHMGQCV